MPLALSMSVLVGQLDYARHFLPALGGLSYLQPLPEKFLVGQESLDFGQQLAFRECSRHDYPRLVQSVHDAPLHLVLVVYLCEPVRRRSWLGQTDGLLYPGCFPLVLYVHL